jgi:hypothetical protein
MVLGPPLVVSGLRLMVLGPPLVVPGTPPDGSLDTPGGSWDST